MPIHPRLCCSLFLRSLIAIQAVIDIPAVIFPQELIAAYPQAKVILTTRDEDTWHKSLSNTLWHSLKNTGDGGPVKAVCDRYTSVTYTGDFEQHGREIYRAHNEAMRKTAPERFLDYRVQDGWDPLCEFLGKKVPNVPFPRHDDWVEYKEQYQAD